MCALLFLCLLTACFFYYFNFNNIQLQVASRDNDDDDAWMERESSHISKSNSSLFSLPRYDDEQTNLFHLYCAFHSLHTLFSSFFSSLVLWSIIIKEFLVFFSFWLNYLDKFFVQTHFSLLKEMMWNVCIVIGHVHPLLSFGLLRDTPNWSF